MTRAYWNGRMGGIGRRINMFTTDFYRYTAARPLHRHDARLPGPVRAEPCRIPEGDRPRTSSAASSRLHRAPIFNKRLVRWIANRPTVDHMLGIPPQQFDKLAGSAAEGKTAAMLRGRIKKMAAIFPIQTNYFAWQAFSGTTTR